MLQRSENLPLPMPNQQEIVDVTASILRAVMGAKDLSPVEVAAKLKLDDCRVIKSLLEKKTAKPPAHIIAQIGATWGQEFIQPYAALFGCKVVPLHCDEVVNALPAITALAAKMASLIGDGRGINHQTLGGMLHELREVDGIVSALRAKASDLGMAA